jgi:serine/threonine-protein kinase
VESFGKYALLHQLGRGGMAEIYLARRRGASEVCVLKLLRGEHRSNATQIHRLKREAHLLSHLDHPNVARILDAGVEGGTFYLALEHIDGRTVRHIIRQLATRGERVPPAHALAIALGALEGLEHAHALRGPEGEALHLVHRDLSPNNLMVSHDGHVKIIDFGLASATIDHYRTQPGVMLGTYRYSAPEQLETGKVDARTDLYTVTAVLYECLTGVPIVRTTDPKEILTAVLSARPPSFAELGLDLPSRLWDVVRSGLAKSPDDRPKDARTLARALLDAKGPISIAGAAELGSLLVDLFDDDAPDPTVRAGVSEETASELVSVETIPGPEPIAVRPTPRRRPLRVGFGLAAAVSLAVVAGSFGVVRYALSMRAPAAIAPAEHRPPSAEFTAFARHIDRLLAGGRIREAAEQVEARAERELDVRDAVAVGRIARNAALFESERETRQALSLLDELEHQAR